MKSGHDYREDWFENWKAEDFRWDALDQKQGFQKQRGSQQQYLKLFSARSTLKELKDEGFLIQCGDLGLFHVIYVWDEWVEKYQLNIDLEQLRQKRRRSWELIENQFTDSFNGAIEGVYVDQFVWDILSRTRAKFKFIIFDNAVSNLFKHHENRKFDNCFFAKTINMKVIDGSHNSKLSFDHCTFTGDFGLNRITNVPSLDFHDCTFSATLTFINSDFGSLNFDTCEIQSLYIQSSGIEKELFVFLTEIGTLEIADCAISGRVDLVESMVAHNIDFVGCDFQNRVTFADFNWPPPGEGTAKGASSTFFEAVRVNGHQPPRISFFDELELQKGVSLGHYSTNEWQSRFTDELAIREQEIGFPEAQHENTLAVIGGCRTLRKVASRSGNIYAEHMWQRAEIISRRYDPDCSRAEAAFSLLYGLSADYGLSMIRPLIWLLVAVLVMSVVYPFVGMIGSTMQWPLLDDFIEGFGFSLSRSLPIGAFGDADNYWRQNLLGSGGDFGSIFVRFLATTQSLVSAILIFFFIMAVRRKFKIS